MMSNYEEDKLIDSKLWDDAQKVFAETPYLKLLGMELLEMSHGKAKLKLPMKQKLRQPHGVLHGGATASVIDTAMAFAVASVLKDGEKASTVDLTVHYLRPVLEGEIFCTAKILRAGRKLLTVSADVVNADGKPIATALSTYAKV